MKQLRYFTLVTLCLLLVNNLQSRDLYLDITIKNPTANQISVSYPLNTLLEEEKIYKIDLKDGKAYTLVQVQRHPTLMIQYGEQRFKIFIEDLETVAFTLDANTKKIEFTGKGKEDNDLFQVLDFSSKKSYSKGYIFSKINQKITVEATKFSSFSDWKNHHIFVDIEFVNENSETADTKALKLLNQEINYTKQLNILAYFIVNKDKLDPTKIKAILAKTNFISHFKMQNDELLKYEFYTNFIQTYL